jgi:hypothetical protein
MIVDFKSTLLGAALATVLVCLQAAVHYYRRARYWRREYGVACEAIARITAERDGHTVIEPEADACPEQSERDVILPDEFRKFLDGLE